MIDNPVERIRAAAAALTDAARRECIEPDGPLGAWVQAQDVALHSLADLTEYLERLVLHTLVKMKGIAEDELDRQRVVTAQTEIALSQARTAVDNLGVEKVRVANAMIRDITPQIVKGVREAVVIREHRYNRDVEYGRVAGAAVLLVALFVGGYIWRETQDWSALTTASLTEGGLQHCRDTSQWVDEQGRRLCVIDDFLSEPRTVASASPSASGAPPQPPPAWKFPGQPPNGPVQFR